MTGLQLGHRFGTEPEPGTVPASVTGSLWAEALSSSVVADCLWQRGARWSRVLELVLLPEV